MQRAMQRLFVADSLQVELASDGIAGLQAFRNNLPSAVVLDLKLPGLPGRELLPAVQVAGSVRSRNRGERQLRRRRQSLAAGAGADDYLTKPFSPKELLARVRRAMRRSQQPDATQVQSGPSATFSFADVCVRLDSMEVTRAGQQVALTPQEFRVLKYFIARPGRLISRDELLNEVWGYQNYVSSRTVDNHILRLRQKLEPNPSTPQHFLTLIGSGYKFVPALPPADR